MSLDTLISLLFHITSVSHSVKLPMMDGPLFSFLLRGKKGIDEALILGHEALSQGEEEGPKSCEN